MAADTAKRRVQCANDLGALQCVANAAAGVVCFICSPLRAREPKTPIVLALSAARNILISGLVGSPRGVGRSRPTWLATAPDRSRSVGPLGTARRAPVRRRVGNVLACARHDTRD